MRLIQFHIGGEEWFINPDKIQRVHQFTLKEGDFHRKQTVITFENDEALRVDESLKTTIARIGNQELNIGYDCLAEIEKLKKSVKNLGRITAPAEL